MFSTRLVIVDRDGVINEDSPASIRSVSEWHPLPGSLEALAELSRHGRTVAIATNQSGIARGTISRAGVDAIHALLRARVCALGGAIAAIAVCPHAADDNCDCRKPRPGLIAQIEARTGVSAIGAPFIGDSLRDIDAALAHGCKAVLVRTGNGAEVEREARSRGVDSIFADLRAAADWLLRQ